jgi:hypothetical protein
MRKILEPAWSIMPLSMWNVKRNTRVPQATKGQPLEKLAYVFVTGVKIGYTVAQNEV